MDPRWLYGLGIALIFIGLLVIIIAILSLVLTPTRRKEETKGAGVIIIGFVPIILGTDKKAVTIVLLLSLTLLILTTVTYLLRR